MKYDSNKQVFYSPLFSQFSDRVFFVIQGRIKNDGLNWEEKYQHSLSEKFISQLLLKFPQLSRLKLFSPVRPEFVDDSIVKNVSPHDSGNIIPDTDGLYTITKNLPLMAMGADCASVAFYDSKNNVVSLLHAGWRGIYGDICATAINNMSKNFGTKAQEIFVAIGPMISACGLSCYEVDDGVAYLFEKKCPKSIITKKGRKTYLNLLTALNQTLVNAGVPKTQIDAETFCTKCYGDTLLYSRRHSPRGKKSQIATIILL